MPNKIVPAPWRTLVRIFEAEGFTKDRQKGSHIIMVKSGIKRPLVIPKYKAVGVPIIQSNCKTAGMSRERYLELLEEEE